jgi:ribosomal-protein-alanine N-acetyltransferase
MMRPPPAPVATLRLMTETDLPRVYAIERATHDFPWTEKILSDCLRVGYLCVVVEVEKRIVGFAITRIHESTELFNITIEKSAQGHGYGRQIMKNLIDFARSQDSKEFLLEVRVSNEPAIKLYKRLGFEQIGVRENYYEAVGGNEDALIFRLGLKLASPDLS